MLSRTGAAWASLGITACLCACATSPALADDGGKFAYNGLIDMYYQYSFNHPPAGALLSGRAFDVENNSFSLSLAEINVTRTTGTRNPLGFTFTGTVGKTADIVGATEPGGRSLRFVQQLYGTYAAGKTTIDFGKFVTAMGYEVIESPANDNYSRSLLFNYAIPFYHMGLRITRPITPALTAQLHLVNGWNDVQDDNGSKSIGVQLNYAPSAQWNWTLNWMGGDEYRGAGLPQNMNLQTLDLVGIWKPTARLKLGTNLDYADAERRGSQYNGHWSGWALYARYQLNGGQAAALRWETFQDTNGLRTGANQNMGEITATYEWALKGGLLTRLEYRHDHAGTAFFPTASGTSKEQDTVSASAVLKF